MSYILVDIPSDGMIRAEGDIGSENDTYGCSSRVVHKTTVNLDRQDSIRCFARLEMAKAVFDPESDSAAILQLNEEGQGETIWAAPERSETLGERLKIWSSCYGGWKVRNLNA